MHCYCGSQWCDMFFCFQDDGEPDLSFDKSYQRSWDDLNMYRSFFSELYEYDVSYVNFLVNISIKVVTDCQFQTTTQEE